jgi:hypothetical protein
MTDENVQLTHSGGDGAGEFGQQELQLAELTKRGATMEEIARLREPVARTPEEAVRALKLGNARYYSGQSLRQADSPVERRAQIVGQTPFAVVLGCSDSRVPTEHVFDQGPGHIFTIRVAGNVVAPATRSAASSTPSSTSSPTCSSSWGTRAAGRSTPP